VIERYYMSQTLRKRSPQAPSVSLEDALNRALKVYDKERRHEIPIDVAAKDMGYKNAKSGSSLQTLASIRYFGLMQRPKEGMLNVSIDVEKYKFSPDPELKQQLLNNWLRTPQVFAELLDKFPTSLPSDAVIKYELIQQGFSEGTADDVVLNFKHSVEFVRYYEQAPLNDIQKVEGDSEEDKVNEFIPSQQKQSATINIVQSADVDRMPIRLEGGRKAFLEIPTPFYEVDKKRLIDQINLILTDKDEISDLV
jgi:hypothetical protein